MKKFFMAHCLFFGLLLSFQCVHANWPTEVDSSIFVDFGFQPVFYFDEAERACFVVYRSGGNGIYAKKYNRYGEPVWGEHRAMIADTFRTFWQSGYFDYRTWGIITGDGAGGIYVSWADYRSSVAGGDLGYPTSRELYLQHIDSAGATILPTHGKMLNTLEDIYRPLPNLVSDGEGGFYASLNYETQFDSSVLRRYNHDAEIIWERRFNSRWAYIAAVNRIGEVFVNTADGYPDTFRQKYDKYGNTLWPDTLWGAIPIRSFDTYGMTIANDDGGVHGFKWAYYGSIYNRFRSDGSAVFSDGIILNINARNYAVSDDEDGFFYRAKWNRNILQRIRRNGSLAFTDTISLAPGGSDQLRGMAPDGYGGVFALIHKGYNTPGSTLYIVRVDSSGQFVWGGEGKLAHQTNGNLEQYRKGFNLALISNREGGAILGWIKPHEIYIKQISTNGNLGEVTTTGIENSGTNVATESFSLEQNYPNPFNGTTQIRYSLRQSAIVEVAVYNTLGQEVVTLFNGRKNVGSYTTTFDSNGLSSGIYIYQLKVAGVVVQSRKLLLLK